MITIRLEETQDYRTVEEITKLAFSYPERVKRSKIGCCLEHYMVHSLRQVDGINDLSFVAEIQGKIIGHIIYSNAYIQKPDGTKVNVLNFGPLSVHPQYQKQGVGSALMKYSIESAKSLGYGAILFFGRPEYYPRFGFVEAKEFGITDCNGYNYPAFMAMELKKDYLKGVSGKFIESPIYNDDLNREQAKTFDENFGELFYSSINVFRCRQNESNFIKEAFQVKKEEDDCNLNEDAMNRFLLNEDNWFYVLTSNNKVLTYAMAYLQRRLDSTKSMICLYEIGTAKAVRNKGLAKIMLKQIIKDAKSNNVGKLWIPTNGSNKAACALYQSISAKKSAGEDSVVFEYRL